MILESEKLINLIDESGYLCDLLLDLLRGDKDMSIILGKAAYSHETMKLTALFMSVYKAAFCVAQRKISVGTRFILLYKNGARTVHRLDGKVFVVDLCCIHIILVVIPVSGGLPKASV